MQCDIDSKESFVALSAICKVLFHSGDIEN